MKRFSRLYHVLAVVSLAAFAWMITLPMVHVVCAMAMNASTSAYAMHGGHAGEKAQDDDVQAQACHRPVASTGQSAASEYVAGDEASTACCMLETAPIRRTTPPASLVKTPTISVAVADAPAPVPARIAAIPSLDGPPTLPAPSHLLFSVLLI